MTQVLRSFLIPLMGNKMATAGSLRGNVVEWLGASITPQGLVLGALCEEEQKPKSSLVLPNGQRPADPAGDDWAFQILSDGEAPPESVLFEDRRAAHRPDILVRPQLAGYAGGFFIYVLRYIREPGITVKQI